MGWTEQRIKYWKNGKCDRKAELEDIYTYHGTNVTNECLKISMKGNVAYVCWKGINKETGEEFITCDVVLTSTRDGYWFGYKDMNETMNPYYYSCPKSILKMLTPTDNEYALEWRKKCAEKKDDTLSILNKCGENSQIELTYKFDTKLAKEGDKATFTKILVARNYRTGRKTYQWICDGRYYRMSAKLIACQDVKFLNITKK